MKNNDVKLVVDKFKFHYKTISKIEGYRLNMTEKRLAMTLNFIKKIKDFTNSTILGEQYLNSFMEFQFNHWFEHEGKFGRIKSIQLEWIIGDKALKRWTQRTEKYKRATTKIVAKNLKRKVDYKFEGVYNKGWSEKLKDVNEIEEFEKRTFHNTAKGFVNCILNTTLYNHKSKNCMTCKFKLQCKAELKLQFPIVYHLRGYKNE